MSDGLSVELVGARDVEGRFARLADGEFRDRAVAGAEEVSKLLAELYRKAAPAGETGSFKASFEAHVTATDSGYAIEVGSSEPDIRRWVRYGTGIFAEPDDTGHAATGAGEGGRIVPTKANVLSFNRDGQDFFFASVAGSKPNKWEDEVTPVAKDLAKKEGQRFAARAFV